MKIKQFLILRLILEIQEIFEANNRSVTRYDLRTSYRSSGEITKLFAKLANHTTMSIMPVRPAGEPPDLFVLKTSWNGWQLSHLS